MMPLRDRTARVGVTLRERAARVRGTQGIQATLLEALVVTYGLGVVALFVSGRVDVLQAGLLLGGPIVLALALLRPEWTILVVVALPPSVTSPIPTRVLIVFMVAALFGFVLQGSLQLSSGTGIYPLVGIIALAFTMKATVSAEATAAADQTLKSIIYYTLVMLVAFNAMANGRIRIDSFLNALLLGIVVTAVLQPFVVHTGFESINITPFRGKFGYLAAMGFGVAYVRLSLNRSEGRRPSRLDAFLALAFLCLTFIGFSRAAWIATLWTFALVSRWTRRKTFWLVASMSLVIVFTVPIVAERIVPVSGADIGTEATLDLVTSGRWELWADLWDRGVEALPMGQGWGYMWSLTANDIFGFETFVSGGSFFIYPHNDFLYLFVELGVVGFGLLSLFWLSLFQKVRRLTRSPREPIRYRVMVLVPVLIVMLMVQMFDNGFAIDFVAYRFFAAAGLVFGLHYLTREGPHMPRPQATWQGPQLPATRLNVGER
jgi:O-antigen ligase